MSPKHFALAALIAGCSNTEPEPAQALDPETFDTEFAERLCSEYASCNPAIQCTAGSAVASAELIFDADKAASCLADEFTCDDSGAEGWEFVQIPISCLDVYGETES